VLSAHEQYSKIAHSSCVHSIMLPTDRAALFKLLLPWLAFVTWPVRIAIGTPNILSDVFHGVAHFQQDDVGLLFTSHLVVW